MKALITKEIRAYLSSLTGYLVIMIFLLLNGMFLWMFDGNFNILDAGYSSLDSLFVLAPWVFMFLIPAITMRMFADEHKAGTLELLFTRPLTELQIIAAKYIAALVLVILTLIPTLIYVITVYQLGAPQGNLDTGATMGSYFGLIFLAACYVGLGILSSAITKNQIVAFMIALFLCFICYNGISSLSSFDVLGGAELFVNNLGIDTHYASISRGVIDSRDVVYFVSFVGLTLLITQTVLRSRKW
ncbi:MAG: ABC-2 type transport system permease protein [Flavobacteriales bacterium]|jgi:ABC-2 type transport system permease protein